MCDTRVLDLLVCAALCAPALPVQNEPLWGEALCSIDPSRPRGRWNDRRQAEDLARAVGMPEWQVRQGCGGPGRAAGGQAGQRGGQAAG